MGGVISGLPVELAQSRLFVDRSAIERYAHLTNDYNPIHLDPEFAAGTMMGGIIAHGMLSLNLIWQSLTASMDIGLVERMSLEVRFIRPVRPDGWVTAGGTRRGMEDAYDVFVRTERETVISGVAGFR